MAPTVADEDYYEILMVTQAADEIVIKTSYKRLAKLRHPDKNPNNPNATADFQRLSAAHSTLIDAQKRREYDKIYPSIRLRRQSTNYHDDPFPSRGPTHPAGATPQPGHNTNAQPANSESLKSKKRVQELEKTQQELSSKRNGLLNKLSDAQRTMEKSREALRKFQGEEDKDAQEAATRNSWYTYVFSKSESPEEKEARERRAAGRRTGRLVRQAEFDRCKAQKDKLDSQMTHLVKEIANISCSILEEKRRGRFHQEEEARRAEERRQWEKREAERRRREAEERKAREEAQRREEMQRRAREEAQRRAREEAQRRAQEEMKKREEAQSQAREEMRRREEIRKAQEERQRKEEIQRQAREEMRKREEVQRRVREEAQRREERQRREQMQRRAQVIQKQARDEAQRRGREETQRREEVQRRDEVRREEMEEVLRKTREQLDELRREQARRAEEQGAPRKEQEKPKPQPAKKSHHGEKKARKSEPPPPPPSSSSSSPCLHRGWWDKIEGKHVCEHCREATTRFALRCPGCSTVACANCTVVLKGRGPSRRP